MSNLAWIIVEIIVIVAILIPTTIAFMFGAPWVPTQMERVKKMVELSGIKRGERLYELGCGDGRLVHHATQAHGADAALIARLPEIQAAIPQVAEFYKVARRRNHVMADLALKKMDEMRAGAAVLIAGGFHTPNLVKMLTDRGAHVVVVAPIVTEATDENLYHTILKTQRRRTTPVPDEAAQTARGD